MTVDPDQIRLGLSEAHLVPWREDARLVHREMKPALEQMVSAAAQDGVRIDIASAFRGFSRQLEIWNAKATGKRKLFDGQGVELDFKLLSADEVILAILRWSALPGASRHHWGTDIDVYDAQAVPETYEVQLTVHEAQNQFARLHGWLDANMARFGFFRPYAEDLHGVAPEPWHLSYAPLAQPLFEDYSYKALERLLWETEIALKPQIIDRLPELHKRFFRRVSKP